MYNSLMHRIVILSGFVVALICFFWNISSGADILYSAFIALCVLLAVSTVFLVALQSIAKVLFKHLAEKKAEQILLQQKKQLTKEKQE